MKRNVEILGDDNQFCAVMEPDLPSDIYFANNDGYIFEYHVYYRALDRKIQVARTLLNGPEIKLLYNVENINMNSHLLWLKNQCVTFYTSKFEAMLHMKHKTAKNKLVTFVQYGYSDIDIERMFIAEEYEYRQVLDNRRWRDIKKHKPINGEKCTYVMYDGSSLYKIGRSVNPSERLRTLSTANPSIKLLMICHADIEQVLHRLFDTKRIEREWFKLDQDDLDVLLSKYGFQTV